jgi:Uma2 family endonuclease
MVAIEANKIYTHEDYFSLEESSEVRHEFINGNLIEMSGASRDHHFICQNILLAFLNLAKPLGYNVFIENMKVKIQGENKYYYPDIFITKETETDENKFVQFAPELIAEVLSDATRSKDMVDKFIQYRKIETLNYYLLVEPEKCLALCYSKDGNSEWQMISYTKMEEIIPFSKLNISLSMNDIYRK